MSRSLHDILKVIEENKIEVVEFKMKDMSGRVSTVTIPSRLFTEEFVQNGITIDSVRGICVEKSKGDAIFVPDLDSATVDLFAIVPCMTISGNIRTIYVNNGVYMAETPEKPKGTRGDKVAGMIFSIVSLYFGISAAVWAIFSAVFSICFSWAEGAGIIFGLIYGFFAVIYAVIAIIFGALGKRKGKRCGRTTGMAKAGLVLGIVSLAILLVPIILFVLLMLLFLFLFIMYFVLMIFAACIYSL